MGPAPQWQSVAGTRLGDGTKKDLGDLGISWYSPSIIILLALFCKFQDWVNRVFTKMCLSPSDDMTFVRTQRSKKSETKQATAATIPIHHRDRLVLPFCAFSMSSAVVPGSLLDDSAQLIGGMAVLSTSFNPSDPCVKTLVPFVHIKIAAIYG